MDNKIALIYENKTYRLDISGEMIQEFSKYEDALKAFEAKIKELDNSEEGKWQNMLVTLKNVEEKIIINNEFKSLEFEGLKYFLKTDKVFFMKNGEMIPLLGGFSFFKAAVVLTEEGRVGTLESLVLFLKELMTARINYRLNELSLLVLSAAFNYGSAEYNFQSEKLNKGASIVDSTFEEFKSYILGIIKK
ncbi:hypothetical protein [uncultured Clostridium sp.]|uniref:hypothetical protein n=1 Tax=uncultured Clostridium sp. TaxID=59620 RepID=UPI0026166220|nr:hypothetical protein [uncultured Clostridium sp.]